MLFFLGMKRIAASLADQSAADILNNALASYGLGDDWRNAYEAVELPDALSGFGEAFEAAFGRDVRAVAPTADKFDIFNGICIKEAPRSVYVNINNNAGFVQVAGHELWHAIQRARPDLIKWYREQSRQYYRNFPEYTEKLNKLLQPGEAAYTNGAAKSELEADFLGDSLADPVFLQKLAESNPSKFKALLNYVRIWLAKVVGRLRGLDSSDYVTDVRALQAYLRDVLNAFADGKDISSAMSRKPLETSRVNRGEVAMSRSRSEADTFVQDVLAELGDVDELFRYPVSKAATLEGVMADVFPVARYIGEDTRIDEREESGADRRFEFLSQRGKRFYVFERGDDEVWIDVSRLEEGELGSGIYAAVANYAYNTGKVFIGDPSGLSEAAIVRRTSNMLSSALRFGTTRHLKAAREQIRGIPEKGIAPLEWYGSDVDKVGALIHTFLANLHNQFPQIRNYRYDFGARQFIDKLGRPVEPGRFKLGADRGVGRQGRAGQATMRRGILLQSLVSSPRSQRPGILEQVLNGSHSLVTQGGLDALFSRKKSPHDPQLQSLLNKIGAGPEKSLAERVREGIDGDWRGRTADMRDRMAQASVDQFHGIKVAEQALGLTDHDRSAYIAARMSTSTDSQLMVALMKGPLRWLGNRATFVPGKKGLLDILQPVEDKMDLWEAYMVARRAKRLMAEGRENWLSKEDIQRGLQLGDQHPVFKTVAADWAAFNRTMLDFAQDAGLIDAAARKLWGNDDYIPLYRIMNDDKAKGPKGRRGLSHQNSGVRMLRGGKAQLNVTAK